MARRKSTAKRWKQAPNPNQQWRDRLTITTPDGKRKELVGYGKTKHEATAALEAKIRKLAQDAEDGTTVADMFALFLEIAPHERGWSTTTLKQYRYRTAQYYPAWFVDKDLTSLTLDDVTQLVTPVIKEGKYTTARDTLKLLRTAVRWFCKRHPHFEPSMQVQAHQILDIRVPKHAKAPESTLWSHEQVNAFLDALKAQYERRYDATAYPFFATALMAGLRTGEILALEHDDLVCKPVSGGEQWFLEVRKQYTFVRGQPILTSPKTAAGVRDVPIPPRLVTILQDHMARVKKRHKRYEPYTKNTLIMPSRRGECLKPVNLAQSKKKVIQELGLPYVKTHHMRKIYTTQLTKQLINKKRYSPKLVASVLGHNNTHTAMDVYTKVLDDDRDAAVVDFETLFDA